MLFYYNKKNVCGRPYCHWISTLISTFKSLCVINNINRKYVYHLLLRNHRLKMYNVIFCKRSSGGVKKYTTGSTSINITIANAFHQSRTF